MPRRKPAPPVPQWFFAARAVILFVIGVVIILHETLAQDTAVRVFVIVSAFLLMGFSAADIAALWGRGND